jgi:hypothetical protein
MSMKTRLARLEARCAPTGGGVAVLLQSGQVSYRGKVFASVADLPPGGYLLAPEAMSEEDWSAKAQAYYREHPVGEPWRE